MARILLIVGFLAIIFWVVSIVDCAVQHPSRHRGVSKGAWIAIVIVLPVLGGLLWFTIGRGRKHRPSKVSAPDDDIEFLRGLGSPSDQDERIRRLEEELAQLDSEADDPPGTTPPAKGSAAGGTAESRDPDDDAWGQRGAFG